MRSTGDTGGRHQSTKVILLIDMVNLYVSTEVGIFVKNDCPISAKVNHFASSWSPCKPVIHLAPVRGREWTESMTACRAGSCIGMC